MRNSYIFCIIFGISLLSCQSKEEKKDQEIQYTTPKKSPELKASSRAFDDQFVDGKPVYTYLKLEGIDQNVLDYYYGNFKIERNDSTKSLLQTLNTSKEHLLPFYYRCFVEICKDSDTTMSEFLGKYTIDMVEQHTEYAMNKLNTGSPDYFTGLISNYIYQQRDWENELNELALKLQRNLEYAPRILRKELDLFIVGIKNDIEHVINKE